MKKRNVLALALAAGLVFGGQAYAEAGEYDLKEEAQTAAANALLEEGQVNNAYDLEQTSSGKWTYVLKITETEEPKGEDKKEEDKKDEKKSVPLTKIEDIAKPNKKEETPVGDNENGFVTKEAAEAAAKKALEGDEINKGYKISEYNGKFYYELTAHEELPDAPVEKEEEEKEAPYAKYDAKATEKTFNFDLGFKTEEEAIKQAEALVKNSEINKGYNVTMGADGRYYIQLSPLAEKTKGLERKPVEKTEDKKEAKAPVKANTNVKTGVAGLTGVVATLAAASAALFKSKRR